MSRMPRTHRLAHRRFEREQIAKQLLDSGFGPSNVQLALAQAHVLWAKKYAPHLLEEWLDD